MRGTDGRQYFARVTVMTSASQVVGKQMVGVYLTVWARRALLKHIRGVQVTSIGTGIMGYLGNKGQQPCCHTQ